MLPSLIARCLVLVLAAVSGFAPAGLAFAHGHAHEHVAEAHAATGEPTREHDAIAHSAVAAAASDRAEHGGDDHTHPRLDATTVRSDVRLDLSVAFPALPAVAMALPPVASVAARLLTVAPPRAGPPGAPPPPSRAPPLG